MRYIMPWVHWNCCIERNLQNAWQKLHKINLLKLTLNWLLNLKWEQHPRQLKDSIKPGFKIANVIYEYALLKDSGIQLFCDKRKWEKLNGL